jgi:hypothetical protein
MFMTKLREISCQFVEFKARHPKKNRNAKVVQVGYTLMWQSKFTGILQFVQTIQD